jgi:hypothetical protein
MRLTWWRRPVSITRAAQWEARQTLFALGVPLAAWSWRHGMERQLPGGARGERWRTAIGQTGLTTLLVTLSMLLASCGLPTGADAARPTVPVPTATPVQLNLTVYSHVTGLTMLSPTEGWAVGDNDVNHQSYLLHLRNGVWSKQTLADGKMEPLAIAMLSPTDGWIAGADHPGWDGQGAMLHLSWRRPHRKHRDGVTG